MPSWHYFSRPSNVAMHDLTKPTTPIPKSLTTIIGLGLKFIPSPRFPNRNPTASFARFQKDFLTKVFFAGRPKLLDAPFNPKMHVGSEWEPKPWDIPSTIHERLANFKSQIRKLMRKRHHRTNNLLPFQKRALAVLALRTDVLVVNCDKNAGPALIETSTYVDRTFSDHLNDETTYRELTEDEATYHMEGVAIKIKIGYTSTKQVQKHGCRSANKNYATSISTSTPQAQHSQSSI